MIEFKKSEPRPDVHYIREISLQSFVKYCSKSTGNSELQELEVEHLSDYKAIKSFCDNLDSWEGEYILFDNTLVTDSVHPFLIKSGKLDNFKNGCHVNFISYEDLKDKVTLSYFTPPGIQSVTIHKDSIDLYLHTLKLLKVSCKIYIDQDSYVR